MPEAVERIGRPASPGLAAGPVILLDAPARARSPSGDAARERRDLEKAVAAAVSALDALAKKVDAEAAAILEFQIAMLEDAALLEPAFGDIAGGADASTAWSAALDGQITEYEGGDDYFRARASDLRDLRDRVLRHLAGEAEDTLPEGAVLAGEDITPSRFLSIDWSMGGGVALFGGSPASHVAMLARSRGVPMIVGLGPLQLGGHREAIVDGGTGRIVLSPGARDWSDFEIATRAAAGEMEAESAAARTSAKTRDGVAISVSINIAGPEELEHLDPRICDGVGLVRTEFLFGAGPPGEETQYRAYRRIADWAAPRPVVLRTLDAGGDKPVAGLTVAGESNPFLGTRGVRLSLSRPDVFRVQLRAMARAAVAGNVRVMLPMVTVPAEIHQAATLLDSVVAELRAEGIPCARPPLGIMVEVPAVAVVPDLFAAAAFFSIGSNDLIQYVTASARDIAAVAALNDAGHPAVSALIAGVVAAARRLGREVSLCGDMGGDPERLAGLIALGLRSVSVAPTLVGRVKRAIAAIDAGEGKG